MKKVFLTENLKKIMVLIMFVVLVGVYDASFLPAKSYASYVNSTGGNVTVWVTLPSTGSTKRVDFSASGGVVAHMALYNTSNGLIYSYPFPDSPAQAASVYNNAKYISFTLNAGASLNSVSIYDATIGGNLLSSFTSFTTTVPAGITQLATITQLAVSNFNHNSAEISFNTPNVSSKYFVYRGNSLVYETPSIVAANSLFEYTFTSLNPSISYNLTVFSGNDNYHVSAPATVNVTTSIAPDITPPAAASSISVSNILQTTATLNFTTPSTTDFNIYKIYKGATLVYTSPAGQAKSSAKTYAITGLTASTPYTYKVTTVDITGNESTGSSTTFATIAVPDTTPPTVPTGLTGTAGIEQATLSWTAVTGVSDLSGYNIYRSGVKQNTSILTGTTYNQSGLIAGQTYTYTVRSVDTTGNISANATSVDVIPLAPPDTTAPVTPSGLAATSGDTTAAISWAANTDLDITGYNVYRDGIKINTETIISTTYLDEGLTNGVEYAYTITAIDTASNESDESTSVSVTPQIDAPEAPIALNASAGNSLVFLSWESVDFTVSYNIKRSTVSGGPHETVTSVVYGTTSYVDESVINGTTYYYVVSAVNSGGESPNSNEVSATPQSNGRALIVITLDNGLEKEYDWSMIEVNAFIDWYDARAAGTGPAKYVVDKQYNKGPFLSRKDYLVFDKIMTFEIMEYEVEEE